jgi:hypothetical protein
MVYKREYPMLGGRRLKPAFEPISEEPPTADELRWSDKLWNYMQEASPQETLAEQQARANIMHQITTMFREWVHSVCLSKGLPPEVAERAGGQVFTSGSYRLGVNEKSMDIDTICVAPRHVTREDFFSSLKVILEDHDSVENLSAIEGATVPIITFDFDGVNIDLLFASLPVDSVPEVPRSRLPTTRHRCACAPAAATLRAALQAREPKQRLNPPPDPFLPTCLPAFAMHAPATRLPARGRTLT